MADLGSVGFGEPFDDNISDGARQNWRRR
jgi:hypothetical protein